jgi:choline kinase/aminoglycoside phosphotransferase
MIIIPLGGSGERFKKSGYRMPKPLVKVLGKPIIFWLLDHLGPSKYPIMIPYHPLLEEYQFEELLRRRYPHIDFRFFKLPIPTNGPVESILWIFQKSTNIPDLPVLCLDGDSFYRKNILDLWHHNNSIFYFEDPGNTAEYSFLRCEKDGRILEIMEKKRISHLACTGAYSFASSRKLKEYSQKLLMDHEGECYLSMVVQLMIQDGHLFMSQKIECQDFQCLGTPFWTKIFSYQNIGHIPNGHFVFDIKCLFGSFQKPIGTSIMMLIYLYRLGHTISIYLDPKEYSPKLLEEYQIPYNHIVTRLPDTYTHYFDHANDLERDVGIYPILERQFNHLYDMGDFIKKVSQDLTGEIYWYTHIPQEIAHLFPKMISYIRTNEQDEIVLEKINGVPVSNLWIYQELTIEQFQKLLEALSQIHQVKIDGEKQSIYQNYQPKIISRRREYNYLKFPEDEHIFPSILEKLEEYQKGDYGIISVVHGDSVFTNIILDRIRPKFIDMRGRLGETPSILGDQLYDWAKIYQSLTGYDEIMYQKYVSSDYKRNFVGHFKKYFITKYGERRWYYLHYLTASLYYSLIPLHNDEKCSDYFNIISRLLI